MAIVVLGSANMDLVVRQERLPLPGETIFGRSFSTVPGGKGLNQAIASARLGGDVEFVGSVGSDEYGARLRRALEIDGVRTTHVGLSDLPTGTAHISVTDTGENSIVVVRGANTSVTTLNDLQRELIRSSDFLVTQFELPLPIVEEALEVAHSAGVFTVLTPAPVQAFPESMLRLVDLIVLNELEALEITGCQSPERAGRILSADGHSALITLGASGCLVTRDAQILGFLPARKVKSVDTTAAGDTFVGALVTRIAAGDQLLIAAEWATIAASISVTRNGASSSMPRLDEVRSLLK